LQRKDQKKEGRTSNLPKLYQYLMKIDILLPIFMNFGIPRLLTLFHFYILSENKV